MLSHDRFFARGVPADEDLWGVEATNREHAAIVDAMVAGDTALAQHRMRRHLQHVALGGGERLRPAWAQEPADPRALALDQSKATGRARRAPTARRRAPS
jgi:hypothetical protein